MSDENSDKPTISLDIFKLNHFLQNQFLSDTIILNKATEKEYFAHKVVIAAGSKYFFYTFLSNDKDQKLQLKENKLVVELPEKLDPKIYKVDDDTILPIIMKYLYNNQEIETIKPELNFHNSFSILALSQALGINSLNKYLSEFISTQVLNEDNCGKIYYEALVYEAVELEHSTLNVLLKNFNKITKNLDEFKTILELPYDLIKTILISDDLVVENEKQVCDIVVNYIKMRRSLEEKKAEDLPKEGDDKNEAAQNKPPEEEKKENPPEVKNENQPEDPNKNPQPIFSQEDLNYAETWKNKLAKLKEKFTVKPLKPEEERALIESIRFSYLSHSDLLSLSVDPIIQNHKDLILEGMSLRLKNYENVDKKDFKINLSARSYLSIESNQIQSVIKSVQPEDKNKIAIDTKSNFNPLSSYDDYKNKNNSYQHQNFGQQRFSPNAGTPVNAIFNSMPSIPNPRPPQSYMFDNVNPNKGLLNSFSQQTSNLELCYEYDFDENGVFYYLGSNGKITGWRNPNDIGQIKVFCSSLGKGRLSDFVGRDMVNLRTMNEPYSYFGVDLGEERTLIPTAYSLKNRNSASHVLLCWQLEGSNDKVNFEILDSRVFLHSDPKIHTQMEKERNALKSPGCTSTWAVDSAIKTKYPNGFRYLILKQIGKNSSGAYNLGLSGFEIYGKCLGKRWHFK